jgi:hypothetical protein
MIEFIEQRKLGELMLGTDALRACQVWDRSSALLQVESLDIPQA